MRSTVFNQVKERTADTTLAAYVLDDFEFIIRAALNTIDYDWDHFARFMEKFHDEVAALAPVMSYWSEQSGFAQFDDGQEFTEKQLRDKTTNAIVMQFKDADPTPYQRETIRRYFWEAYTPPSNATRREALGCTTLRHAWCCHFD